MPDENRNPNPSERLPERLPEHRLILTDFNAGQAVLYAEYWAYRRNPSFYSFDRIGGDCTNFVSQAVFYAAGVMNYTPTYGWYYISLGERSPSWTGVTYFWDFMTTNAGPGPFGNEIPLTQARPGDVIQMAIRQPDSFGHSVLVTQLLTNEGSASPDEILVAAHDTDCACRPVSTYDYHMIRVLRIDGVRYFSAATDQHFEQIFYTASERSHETFSNSSSNFSAKQESAVTEPRRSAESVSAYAEDIYREPEPVG